jgi:thiamine biosynthesis protein ThiI
LKTYVLDVIKDEITSKTSFALKVRREGNHEYTSRDVAVHLGNVVVKETKAKVDLSNPDVTVYIEIRDKNAFFFFEKYLGPGGLPLGSQGKVLSLIDSKNESFLATWYMMRRGCIPVFLLSDKKLIDELKSFGINWYFNPQIIESERDHTSINNICLKNDCNAVITGDTMHNFSDIIKLKEKSDQPILHPLISMDKEEIKNKVTELGLF